MYYISKRLEIAGAHHLDLPYESKCSNIHGHNWIVTIYRKAGNLTEYGMIVDFKKVKTAISDKLDHRFINEVVDFNPTAENIAKWICDEVDKICEVGTCYKVSVQESEGNTAIYER
jgi:6-pyruvoyltetrahydropterin/6-carboxytetrahydropterin synthase